MPEPTLASEEGRASKSCAMYLGWIGSMHAVLALLIAIVAAACQFVARDTGGDVTIEGRVLDSQTNEPIPGARVTLKPTRLPFPDGSWEALETETAADGTFVFHVEGPITYQLTAAHDSYINPDPPWESDAPSFEADEGTQPARTLLRLNPGYVVRGRVVAANTGEPLPDSEVVVMRPEQGVLDRPIKDSATDNDGYYELHGLAAGEYRIELRPVYTGAIVTMAQDAPDGTISYFSYRPSSEAGTVAEYATISPERGTVTTQDFTLQRARTSVIHGRIVADTGIEGREVRLEIAQDLAGPSSTLRRVIRGNATTSIGAEFRIMDLTPGRYWIRASTAEDDPDERLSGSAEVLLGEVPVKQDIVLGRAVRLHGRVIVEDGEVSDDWKLSFKVERREGQMSVGIRHLYPLARDGSYSVDDLYPNQYSLDVQGAPRYQVTKLRLDGRTTAGHRFDVSSGVDEHELDVFLERRD